MALASNCGARGWPRTVGHEPLNFQIPRGDMQVVSSFSASRPPRGSRDATRRMSCCGSATAAAPSRQQQQLRRGSSSSYCAAVVQPTTQRVVSSFCASRPSSKCCQLRATGSTSRRDEKQLRRSSSCAAPSQQQQQATEWSRDDERPVAFESTRRDICGHSVIQNYGVVALIPRLSHRILEVSIWHRGLSSKTDPFFR